MELLNLNEQDINFLWSLMNPERTWDDNSDETIDSVHSVHEKRVRCLNPTLESLKPFQIDVIKNFWGVESIPDLSAEIILSRIGEGGYCEENEYGIWYVLASSQEDSGGWGVWSENNSFLDNPVVVFPARGKHGTLETPPLLRALITKPIIVNRSRLDPDLLASGRLVKPPQEIDEAGIISEKVLVMPGQLLIPQSSFRRSELWNELVRGKHYLGIEYGWLKILVDERPNFPGEMVLSPYRLLGTDIFAGDKFIEAFGNMGVLDNEGTINLSDLNYYKLLREALKEYLESGVKYNDVIKYNLLLLREVIEIIHAKVKSIPSI